MVNKTMRLKMALGCGRTAHSRTVGMFVLYPTQHKIGQTRAHHSPVAPTVVGSVIVRGCTDSDGDIRRGTYWYCSMANGKVLKADDLPAEVPKLGLGCDPAIL